MITKFFTALTIFCLTSVLDQKSYVICLLINVKGKVKNRETVPQKILDPFLKIYNFVMAHWKVREKSLIRCSPNANLVFT